MRASSPAFAATAVGLAEPAGGRGELGRRGHPGEHEHRPRSDAVRRQDVRAQVVADDDRRARLPAGQVGGLAKQPRFRFADDEVRLPSAGHGEGRHDRSGARGQGVRGREVGVAIGGHEPRPAPDRLGGDAQAAVREGEVDPHHDRAGVGRQAEVAWRHGAPPDLADLTSEPGTAEDHHRPQGARRRAAGQGEGRGSSGCDDEGHVVRRAHARQAGRVIGAVPARVIGHVDDRVTGRHAAGQEGRHAGHGDLTAVDDAVQVDDEEHQRMVGQAAPATGVRRAPPDDEPQGRR